MIKTTKSVTTFDTVNYILLSFVFVIVLYPLMHTIIASISDPKLVATGQIWFLPRGINFNAYKNVFTNDEIWLGYKNTIIYTLVGTTINLTLTLTCAFAL